MPVTSRFRFPMSSPSNFKRATLAVFCAAAFAGFVNKPARAWNAMGHMTIGAIAEPRLTPNARAQVERLLPLVPDARTPDFLSAGVWMDDIRADGVRLYDRWHYHNLGFSPDNTPVPDPHADNVAWAIETNVRLLKSEKVSDDEKARALRFLLHTAQDAHNPVHAGSRFTKDNPDGDSGANEFRLLETPDFPYRNLHALWDGALGTFPRVVPPWTDDVAAARLLAITLTTRYPEVEMPESSVLEAQKWSEEGATFLPGPQGVYPLETFPAAPITPDAAYLERMRPVAEKRATLAGYRLARLLNSIWP